MTAGTEEIAPAIPVEQWRFEGEASPDPEEIVRLLASLPPVWGVKTVDYANWVHPLPNTESRERVEKRGGREFKIKDKVKIWTLYMSVAGRIKMLEEAQLKNGWVVDFIPEPVTSTGSAGVVFAGGGAIAYRVTIAIRGWRDTPDGKELAPLGTRTGVSKRDGSNNWEKAETAANGRALGAWGFGVLPGSGIVSLEEMQTAERSEGRAPAGRPDGYGTDEAPTRDELIQQIKVTVEQIRDELGNTVEVQQEKVCDYLVKRLGYNRDLVWDAREAEVLWEPVQTAHLSMYLSTISKYLVELKAAESGV